MVNYWYHTEWFFFFFLEASLGPKRIAVSRSGLKGHLGLDMAISSLLSPTCLCCSLGRDGRHFVLAPLQSCASMEKGWVGTGGRPVCFTTSRWSRSLPLHARLSMQRAIGDVFQLRSMEKYLFHAGEG